MLITYSVSPEPTLIAWDSDLNATSCLNFFFLCLVYHVKAEFLSAPETDYHEMLVLLFIWVY